MKTPLQWNVELSHRNVRVPPWAVAEIQAEALRWAATVIDEYKPAARLRIEADALLRGTEKENKA